MFYLFVIKIKTEAKLPGIFKERFNTQSAGLYNAKPVNEKQISWADMILVMEETQRNEIAKRFPKQYMLKRILSLDIPDVYQYNQPELIEILNLKISGLFKPCIK